ncbi:MAG: hypothetical protein ABW118_06460 [Candidatus Thiodiazotropha sp.]
MKTIEVTPRIMGIVMPVLSVAGGAFTWIFFNAGEDYTFTANVMLGVTTGLLTATFVFWISRLIPSRVPEILETIPEIKDQTERIMKFLQRRDHVVVEALERQGLGKDFYEELFSKARYIDISGIALTRFTETLCEVMCSNDSDPLPEKHILNQIHKRRIHVRAVLIHPDSDFAKERELIEGRETREHIRNSIGRLEKLNIFLTTNNPFHPKNFGGNIEIRLSSTPKMPYSISRADPAQNGVEAFLLGIIPASTPGEMAPAIAVYTAGENLPTENMNSGAAKGLSEICKRDFHELYTSKGSYALFKWKGNKHEIHDTCPISHKM